MIRKQVLNPVFAVFACCFLLSACESLPVFHATSRGSFKPLSSDVAMLAAPQVESGQPLYCAVGKGAVHTRKGWVDFQPATFVLEPGGRTQVQLRTKAGGVVLIQGRFDVEGQKLIFCPVIDAPPEERIACSSIYALEDDLQAGIKRTFDVPNAVRGGSITCAYNKERLKKL